MAKTTKQKISVNQFYEEAFGSEPTKTLKDLFEINDAQMEYLYNHAYRLFQAGKFMEALPIFGYLYDLDPYGFRYVFAMAACRHHMKQYDVAVEHYLDATSIEPNNPTTYYYLYDCLEKLKNFEKAELVLNLAIETAKGQSKYKDIKKRAELELAKLESNKKNRKR